MVNHGIKCMGCGGCEIICPKKCISVTMSADGFYRPTINETDCINCGLCNQICPIDNVDTSEPICSYSYKSISKESLNECASGGFSYDLLESLVNDYDVCSVKYNSMSQSPEHVICRSSKELEQCRNSIYLQSYSVSGIDKIIKKDAGVVVGTPCQISAVHNILTKMNKRSRFVLIDFFCHGVPSYNLWIKYINDNEDIFADKPMVKFRSKKNGWGNFTLQFDTENSTRYSDYAQNKNIFFKMFLENIVLNEPCYQCPYHGTRSSADIRMGDLWGTKFDNDREGVSGILAFTENGKNIVESMNDVGFVNNESIDIVCEGQLNGDLPVPECRKAILKALQSNKTLNQINSTTFFRYKLKRRIRQYLKNSR